MATKDQVAQLIVGEAKARNHTRDECLAELSALYQESQLDETVWGPAGKKITYGVAQQDGSYPNRFQGASAQVKAFFDKLDVKRKSPGHGDIWLNICWLQQAPNWPSAAYWYDNGRRAYLTEIKSRIATVTPYLDKYWPVGSGNPTIPQSTEPGIAPNPSWRGDPTFLPEVLRAEGLTVREVDGWRDRGHGDFAQIWGVIAHHTGSNNASAESIAFHPTLGLASQIHLARDGVVTLCGVGIAWHAGQGSYPGLPANDANRLTIGIEAANDGGGSPGKPHRSSWPDAQYNAYVKTVAAILRFLGHDSSHVISHKEWAGAAQGKWDPGAIDMNIFRADVQARINTTPAGGISMADAKAIEGKLDGVDGAGKPYDYRLVDLDRVFTVGDGASKGDPDVEALPSTPSVFDHVTKLARVLTKRKDRKGQKLDVAEMLSEVLDAVDRIEAKLDGK